MIPKTIHYCWFGGNPYPPLVEQCIDSWKEQLPDYQIKRWDESNSPIENCRFSKQAYEAKKWAFVSDYVRIYALYNEGGIYLDTDMLVLKSLDPFLKHSCFLGLEKPGRANAAIVGAVSNHAYTREMLKQYENSTFDPKRLRLTAIPQRFSEVLRKQGMTAENVQQEVFGVHIYPTDFFYPWPLRPQMDFMSFVTPNSFAIHLWEGSWVEKETAMETIIKFPERFIRHWIVKPIKKCLRVA